MQPQPCNYHTALLLCPLDTARPNLTSLRPRLEDLEKTLCRLSVSSRLLVVIRQPELQAMHARNERTSSWRQLEYLLNTFYTVAYEFNKSHHGSPISPSVDIVVEQACGYDPFVNASYAEGIFVNRSALLELEENNGMPVMNAALHDLQHINTPSIGTSVAALTSDSNDPFEAFCKQTQIHVEVPAALMSEPLPNAHQSVVLGGTFDHFHSGHKILLTMACWLSKAKVTCGISSDALLRNKKHRDLMESFEERQQSVRQFCKTIGKQIDFQTGAINDIYGPTATEPSYQAIVVSMESLSGGRAVNAKRLENGLRPLYIYVIDVVSGLRSSGGKDKLGSTEIREWINHSRTNSVGSGSNKSFKF